MLVIKFKKGGGVEMTPTGYPGASCRAVTQHFAKYMAGDVARDTPTEEAAEPEQGYVAAPKNTETA